jgi:amidase
MDAADLLTRPVDELAALVRARSVSAAELVEASVRRIEALDPQLHAFIDVDGEGALAQAAAIAPDDPRPFAGIPIAIKNNRAVAGWRMTQGADLTGDFTARVDHNVVRRLKGAGFVVVGTTNLPEYGIQPITQPRRFPATRNPWDPSRTPGGSSGGSAAAVAAGMVPIAHGNDGGGSLRIPAACCGLVGLKAARGRISPAPFLGESPLVIDGVLTRTVAETALLLDVLAGYEHGDATWAPAPTRPFAQAAGDDPGPLRIAIAVNPPLAHAIVDPVELDAVADVARRLEGLGHAVTPIVARWSDPQVTDLFDIDFITGIAQAIEAAGRLAGRPPRPEDMQALSWALLKRGRRVTAIELSHARARVQARMRALIVELDAYDAVLTPALAQRPPTIGALDADGPDPTATWVGGGAFTPFTAIANASGLPALALPVGLAADGLPLAVQLIGRPAREDVLLALGAQLERAIAWDGTPAATPASG